MVTVWPGMGASDDAVKSSPPTDMGTWARALGDIILTTVSVRANMHKTKKRRYIIAVILPIIRRISDRRCVLVAIAWKSTIWGPYSTLVEGDWGWSRTNASLIER